MKLKTIRHLFLSVALLLLIIFKVGTVHADTPSFTVRPVIPENQIGVDQGYYNLIMKRGASQEVSAVLTNTTAKEITIDISFSHATTNDNGLAIYEPSSDKKDPSLSYKLDDFVKIPKREITLSAHSQTTIKSSVSMPKAGFDGVLAGGFTFKEKKTSHTEQVKTGISITNEFRYITALVIQQNTTPVPPKLQLQSVQASQVNARNVITANLQNASATYIKDMAITATVQGETDKTINYTYTSDNMKMAPNSSFPFAIPVSQHGDMKEQASKALKPGKYRVSMTVFSQKNKTGSYQKTTTDGKQPINYDYKWTFDKEFVISKSEATKLNTTDPTVRTEKKINWLLILLIAIICFLLILSSSLVYLLWKKRQYQKEA